jgi:sphingolipid delta-4 desaturase
MDHHRFQGVDGIDGDLPTKLEGYLLNNVFGKIFFCSFQILFYGIYCLDRIHLSNNLLNNHIKTIYLKLAIRPKISATPRTYRIPQTFLEWVFSWYTMNYVIQLSVMAAVMYAWGWSSMAYLVASVLLGGSLHPMAAHFLAEHYVTHPGQETYSYYGWLNKYDIL